MDTCLTELHQWSTGTRETIPFYLTTRISCYSTDSSTGCPWSSGLPKTKECSNFSVNKNHPFFSSLQTQPYFFFFFFDLVTYLDAGEDARSFEHLKHRVLPLLVRYMMKDDRELKVLTETIVEQYFNQTNFGDQDQIVKAFSNV